MPHEEEGVLTVLEPFPNLKEPKPKLIELGFESNLDSDALRNKLPKDFARKNGNINQTFKASTVNVGNGATGTFTTVDSKTVTVTNGIITAIV